MRTERKDYFNLNVRFLRQRIVVLKCCTCREAITNEFFANKKNGYFKTVEHQLTLIGINVVFKSLLHHETLSPSRCSTD